MLENPFFPVINHPTQITDTSAIVLDHIWTNITNHTIKSGIITSSISDHLPVLACTNIKSKQKQLCENLTKRRQFTSRNYARFSTELQHIDIEPVLNETSPNKALNLLITKYSSCFDKCFPLTTVNATGHNNAWYDKELKNLLHVKNKLYKKYLCKKSLFNKLKFNRARNFYFHILQGKKKSYYASVFEQHKNNIKETSRTINKLIGKTKAPHCSSLVIDNNQLSSDQLAIANHFNNHFENIASKLVDNLSNSNRCYRDFLNPFTSQSIYLNPTTPTEVGNIIREMKSKYSCGMDGIPTSALKNSPGYILTALSHVVNLSLSQGIFFQALKLQK